MQRWWRTHTTHKNQLVHPFLPPGWGTIYLLLLIDPSSSLSLPSQQEVTIIIFFYVVRFSFVFDHHHLSWHLCCKCVALDSLLRVRYGPPQNRWWHTQKSYKSASTTIRAEPFFSYVVCCYYLYNQLNCSHPGHLLVVTEREMMMKNGSSANFFFINVCVCGRKEKSKERKKKRALMDTFVLMFIK